MTHEICTAPIDTLVLKAGKHRPGSGEYCAVEAAVCRFTKGEKHSDWEVDCNGSPSIAYGMIMANDNWDHARRQQLIQIVDRLPNTKGTREQERIRAFMAAEFAVREVIPELFDAAQMPEEAKRLRALAPITDKESANAAVKATRAAYNAACTCTSFNSASAAVNAATNAARSAVHVHATSNDVVFTEASGAVGSAILAAKYAGPAYDSKVLGLFERLIQVTAPTAPAQEPK